MMTSQEESKAQEYIFLDESPWHIRLLVWLTTPFYKLMGIVSLISPMVANPGVKPSKDFLAQFASMVGIGEQESKQNLSIHQRRYLQYFYIVLLPAVFLALAIVVLLIALFFPTFPLERWNVNLSTALTWVLFASINVIAFSIIFRVEQTIADKYFAETLAVIACISFMQELMRDDALEFPARRVKLQMRLDYLSRALILLAYRFQSSSSEANRRIYQHFKNMESFVREREQWVVAPRKDTLTSLRRDFIDLLRVLISGNYGEFKSNLPEVQDSQSDSSRKKIYNFFVRLLGIIIPLAILFLIYENSERIALLGIDGNAITLIAVAWLLLSIDAAFKLGIVDRIFNLARTFRDL